MSPIRLQGRLLTEADLNYICQLPGEHPEWSRLQLSIHLAEQWQWRNPAGQLKDMAARTLLLKLHRRGLLHLPPPRRSNSNHKRQARCPTADEPDLFSSPPDPIEAALCALQPLSFERVENRPQRQRIRELLQRHHYQGFSGAVGENVQYLIHDFQGRELAVMVFGAAAWKVASRDRLIGWTPLQRQAGLSGIVNQQRFLILPWVRVDHLASHLLARALKALKADWQKRYGHPVWLVETFVRSDLFEATAYKAAGWTPVGQTTGRTRQDRERTLQTPIKSVWIKALHPRFRDRLTAP